MDFELSEDEVALADGMRRLCAGRFPLETVRGAEGERVAIDASGWSELADAGVFSLRLAEDAGGLGLGTAAAAVVFEELGRALVPGPDPRHPPGGRDRGRRRRREGHGGRGAATRRAVGPGAAPVVIEHLGSLGALVVVGDDGLAVVDPATLDAVAVERSLDPLTPLWLRRPSAGGGAGRRSRRHGACGDATRPCSGVHCSSGWRRPPSIWPWRYAKERQQFGKPIGSFQAVKHLCADMLVRAEVARAAVHAAAVTIDQPDVGDAVRAAAGAGLLAVEAAMANGKSCIQVHGGMGFTWEVPAHLYLMRARVLAGALEGTDALAELVAERY